MKIEDYWVSQFWDKHPVLNVRHVSINDISNYLCNYAYRSKPLSTLYDYSINNTTGVPDIPICKTCLNKLPTKVKEEFIYNWTVTKLKAK